MRASTDMVFQLTICMIIAVFLLSVSPAISQGATKSKKNCLVLADGYLSEYAWSFYQEGQFPAVHPGHDFLLRGLLDYQHRFSKWLPEWNIQRIDLEKHKGPLPLKNVSLVILDDVRQIVADPYETTLVEFVRSGGGLLMYAGKWGLGGYPKNQYSVITEVASYGGTPLGKILPVEINKTPDWLPLSEKPRESRVPVFNDQALARGIDSANWQILAVHDTAPKGEVLAQVAGSPLISRATHGKGTIVVYTADDLGWIQQGFWSGAEASQVLNKYSGTLWRRLASLAIRSTGTIAAVADPPITWEKSPAFAHPDQPMNLQWGGYFYYTLPEIVRLWAKDLVEHSATLYFGANKELGDAGIQGWESIGPPLYAGSTEEDPATWMVDASGRVIENTPCYNNPKALELMSEAVTKWATELHESKPWVAYGHMGDESEWKSCYCTYCQEAFKKKFGYELPDFKNDFSDDYLKQWMDFHLFKNESLGRMYALAGQAAKKGFPGIKMFASLPVVGGMTHGDDLYHTQSGFDLLWDHTYPGTMVVRVGMSAELLEETAVLQKRPYAPVFNLLQGFDSYDRVPNMPPAEYMREMAWQAIAHGVDSIGWFVYNAYFWNLPGTEAWEEAKRLADQVLSPMTPTLYEMKNTQQPVALLYSYSQEAVDGLKELTLDASDPWKGVIRWWGHHAFLEAYAAMKYSQVPFNVVSEHRILQGMDMPWKAVVIPYVEFLHPKSRAALEQFMAKGGTVYIGSNSTLKLSGAVKLPVSFDTEFTTMWPKDDTTQWNQRRVRNYMIGPALLKAAQIGDTLKEFTKTAMVSVEDPEVVYNVREAGSAKYLFFVNDHQINPASPALRKTRQKYNHFMLMPMEFPRAKTSVKLQTEGYLYPLMQGTQPIKLQPIKPAEIEVELKGGDGKIYLLVPEKITKIEFTGKPVRTDSGVKINARILGSTGVIKAGLPVKVVISSGKVSQTAYATTKRGVLQWTCPFLKQFPTGPLKVVISDIASGKSATAGS